MQQQQQCTVKTMFTSMAHSIAGNKHSYGLFMAIEHCLAHHFAVRNPGLAQVQCMSLQVHGMCLAAFLFLGGEDSAREKRAEATSAVPGQ